MLFVVLFSASSNASDTVTVVNVAGMTKWLEVNDYSDPYAPVRIYALSEGQTIYVPRGVNLQQWDDAELTLGNGYFAADFPFFYLTSQNGMLWGGEWPESTFLPGFILGGTLAGWILYLWILTLVRRSVVET